MSLIAITPSWVGTFEKAQRTLIQNAWDRVNRSLIWDKFMEVRPSSTLTELYMWLYETAQIYDEGQGGQKSYDSVAATFFEITNRNSGSALRLTRNEIEDNMLQRPGMTQGGPALDYAANWARQIGGASAYWPQEKMFELVKSGETLAHGSAYDGRAFFAKDHPVNKFDSSKGIYANLLSGAPSGIYPGACPIDIVHAPTLAEAAANFAAAVAYIETLTQPNGKPRYLKVKYALSGQDLKKRLNEILSTRYFGQDGSTENVLTTYGIEPVTAPELTTPGEYYLACEQLTNEGGGLIFQDRSPYVLTSYTPETQAQLQVRKEFEWSYDGRNAVAYGHPYLMFKIKPI
jgi:phage major head subunit gpT-like protein